MTLPPLKGSIYPEFVVSNKDEIIKNKIDEINKKEKQEIINLAMNLKKRIENKKKNTLKTSR